MVFKNGLYIYSEACQLALVKLHGNVSCLNFYPLWCLSWTTYILAFSYVKFYERIVEISAVFASPSQLPFVLPASTTAPKAY